MRHYHQARKDNGDGKLITCQRKNLKRSRKIFTDTDLDLSGEESKSHECHDRNDDKDT